MAVLLRLGNIPSQESWPQESWPDLIRTLTKLMNRVPFGSVEDLLDYYNMCESLAQLGLHWPIKWNEFHVKNVDYFLSHLPEQYHGIATAAEDNYPRWREEGFGTVLCLLHSIQNEISARARLREEEARDKELDDQYEPWRKQLEKLAWTGKHGLSMFVPTHLAELTYEGSTLHHCVGSYKHSVAKAQEGILFLRRTDTPDKPYFTIDVVKNGKLFDIRQAHGYANSDPSEDVIVALKEWADDTGLINLSTIAKTYGALCAKCW